jgi:hypothetical protein
MHECVSQIRTIQNCMKHSQSCLNLYFRQIPIDDLKITYFYYKLMYFNMQQNVKIKNAVYHSTYV